jgi:hypothetical protein
LILNVQHFHFVILQGDATRHKFLPMRELILGTCLKMIPGISIRSVKLFQSLKSLLKSGNPAKLWKSWPAGIKKLILSSGYGRNRPCTKQFTNLGVSKIHRYASAI